MYCKKLRWESFARIWGQLGRWLMVVLCLVVDPCPLFADVEQAPRQAEKVSAKVLRYVQRIMKKYDRNGDGRIDEEEFRLMHGDPRRADLDQDGVITLKELAERVASYGRRCRIRLRSPNPAAVFVLPFVLRSPEQLEAETSKKTASKKESAAERRFYVPRALLPQGLPDWFNKRDADGDGQLTFSEFSQGATRAEIERYSQYDLNGDGMLTARELQRSLQRFEQDQSAESRPATNRPEKTAPKRPATKP
ncbi:MAG: EF-hand domain-containing protein [Pirellulales bacterium]